MFAKEKDTLEKLWKLNGNEKISKKF